MFLAEKKRIKRLIADGKHKQYRLRRDWLVYDVKIRAWQYNLELLNDVEPIKPEHI